jgi:hypothetical protein
VGQLTRSAQLWYAQHLADALHRGRWQKAQPQRAGDSAGGAYRAVGGGSRPKPRVVQAEVPALPRAFVRPASVVLGWAGYQRALSDLEPHEWEAWWDWLRPHRDKLGRPRPPNALFRAHGGIVRPGDVTARAEQGAALKVLHHAAVWIVLGRSAVGDGPNEVNEGSSSS